MNILFWLYKSRMNKKGLSPLMMRITIEGKRAEVITPISNYLKRHGITTKSKRSQYSSGAVQ